MSSASMIRHLQLGLQTTGPTQVPGSFQFIDTQGDPVYAQTNPGRTPVDLQRDDGLMAADEAGVKTGQLSFDTLLRGKGSGAGDGTTAVGGELDELMDALTGFSGQHGEGTTVNDLSPAVASFDLTSIANIETGQTGTECASGIMVETSSGYHAREIHTRSSNTVTVDRDLPEAPADAAVVYAATSWYFDGSNPDHSHIYAKLEGEDWRDALIGCGVTGSLTIPEGGGRVSCSWALDANDVDDTTAEEDPTYSAATSATGIAARDCFFYIDDTSTDLIDASIQFGAAHAPKGSINGAQGANGKVYTYNGSQISLRLYYTDALWTLFSATATIDIAFQLGTTPGNCWYIRVPAFQSTSIQKEKYNGVDIINITGKDCRQSGRNGSLRMHCFASAA